MAYGTLPNIANAGHEPTPDERARQITYNLLKLPRSHFTVIDGTCGEGNLLAPFQGHAHAELVGIEINGKWAELAAQRLPQAQIITAAVEHVSIAPNSISLATLNPPYLVTNGGRMELQVFRHMCDTVQPHGVIACIIPARSAWDRRFITAWARRCYDVRVWKFPSTGDVEDRAGFERYSQIVVIGYKRPQQLAEADEREIIAMLQWRYVRNADGEYHWVGKQPPPDLPDHPIADPYRVPPAATRPTITIRKASEALVVQALAHSGCHRDPRWAAATLLRHWASQSALPWAYWMAQKEPAELQRRKLYAAIRGRAATPTAPTFASWSELWDDVAAIIRDDRRILVLDELPWAIEADGAMLSALQYAWDIHFQHANLILVLCGSQIRTMETILHQQTPLFGRLTAQYHLQPFPFEVIRQFFPTWSPDAQVAVYAMVGGVPHYLSWFTAERSLNDNIRQSILAPASVALSEIELLLSDEVRDIRTYLTVLNAIGEGAHALKDIADATLTASTNLTKYLGILQELRLVERRVPATVPPALQHRSKQGRYHLTDPFHRFYFRFLRPREAEIAYQPDSVLAEIQSGLRAFVGQTAWGELARTWVFRQGMHGTLSFKPEAIGSHWSRAVQADVVAVSWRERVVLVGECKWGTDRVNRQVVRQLIEHTLPNTSTALPDQGRGWHAIPALFARAGATADAQALLHDHGGLLIDLPTLYADLGATTGES